MLSRKIAFPVLTGSTNVLSPLMQYMSKRTYFIASKSTRFDSRGNVSDPGHVQIHTTPEEQRKYGVKPVYGHSPHPGATSTHHFSTDVFIPAIAEGEKPVQIKSMKSFVKKARGFNEDHDRGPEMTKVDMGEMNEREATVLKNFHHDDLFEVTGKRKQNCVHGTFNALAHMHDLPPLPEELHNMMPQQVASYVARLRGKKTDGK